MEILLIWKKNFFKCDKDTSPVQEDDSWTKWECQKRDKIQKESKKDFPGSPMVKNSPSHAGDMGSIPSWETKIPYASELLSPCSYYLIRRSKGKNMKKNEEILRNLQNTNNYINMHIMGKRDRKGQKAYLKK